MAPRRRRGLRGRFALGMVVAGELADRPTGRPAGSSHSSLYVSSAAPTLESAGRSAWAGVMDRAEGRPRGDLLSAALSQPLSALFETAAGEILDRVDDDTHGLGLLMRRLAWHLIRTLLRVVPMWVVAVLTWWPAWILFPVTAAITTLVVRPVAGEVSRAKVAEEIAWTDHAAVMEGRRSKRRCVRPAGSSCWWTGGSRRAARGGRWHATGNTSPVEETV